MISMVWVSSCSLCLIPLHISPKYSSLKYSQPISLLIKSLCRMHCTWTWVFLCQFSCSPLSSQFIQTSEIPTTHRNKDRDSSVCEKSKANGLAMQDKAMQDTSSCFCCFCSFSSQSQWPEKLKRDQLLRFWGSSKLVLCFHVVGAVGGNACPLLIWETCVPPVPDFTFINSLLKPLTMPVTEGVVKALL